MKLQLPKDDFNNHGPPPPIFSKIPRQQLICRCSGREVQKPYSIFSLSSTRSYKARTCPRDPKLLGLPVTWLSQKRYGFLSKIIEIGEQKRTLNMSQSWNILLLTSSHRRCLRARRDTSEGGCTSLVTGISENSYAGLTRWWSTLRSSYPLGPDNTYLTTRSSCQCNFHSQGSGKNN